MSRSDLLPSQRFYRKRSLPIADQARDVQHCLRVIWPDDEYDQIQRTALRKIQELRRQHRARLGLI